MKLFTPVRPLPKPAKRFVIEKTRPIRRFFRIRSAVLKARGSWAPDGSFAPTFSRSELLTPFKFFTTSFVITASIAFPLNLSIDFVIKHFSHYRFIWFTRHRNTYLCCKTDPHQLALQNALLMSLDNLDARYYRWAAQIDDVIGNAWWGMYVVVPVIFAGGFLLWDKALLRFGVYKYNDTRLVERIILNCSYLTQYLVVVLVLFHVFVSYELHTNGEFGFLFDSESGFGFAIYLLGMFTLLSMVLVAKRRIVKLRSLYLKNFGFDIRKSNQSYKKKPLFWLFAATTSLGMGLLIGCYVAYALSPIADWLS